MPDVVVTVPLSFGMDAWYCEGDPAGTPWTGQLWDFTCGCNKPNIQKGDRVYVVYDYLLRGYAPLVDLVKVKNYRGGWSWSLVRGGGAVALTIPKKIKGFRGWRYCWWDRSIERPFPEWIWADRTFFDPPEANTTAEQGELFK